MDSKTKPSAGRPKKKGFQKKTAISTQNSNPVDFVVNTTSQPLTRYVRNPPVGLLNGCNICFINCVLQILYYIPSLSERLEFCHLNGMVNPITTALREIFREISSSALNVNTSKYFNSLKGSYRWTLGNQQDSNEFLINVLQCLYAKKNSIGMISGDLITNCPFNINIMKSLKCVCCTKHSEKYTNESTLALPVNSNSSTSIQHLLNICKHTEEIVEYTLDHGTDNCLATQCTQTEDIVSVSDYLIIQLNVFDFDQLTQRPFKKQPGIIINKDINIAGNTMNLCGIVFHSGPSALAGHYKSVVLVEGCWYMTNDTIITEWIPNFDYNNKSDSFPYFVFYKKSVVDQNMSLENITMPAQALVSYADIVKESKPKNEKVENSSFISLKHQENDVPTQKVVTNEGIDKMYDNLSNVVEKADLSFSENIQFSKHSVVRELFQQTEKIAHAKERNDDDFKKACFKKRKSKFGDNSSTKRVKKTRSNLSEEAKEKQMQNDKTRKKQMRSDMPDEIKEKEKQGAKSRMKNLRDIMPDEIKENEKQNDKTRKKQVREKTKEQKDHIFLQVQRQSKVHHSILKSEAYQIIKKKFDRDIADGPTHTCDICWKNEFRSNVVKLDLNKYDDEIIEKCYKDVKKSSDWICKNCNAKLLKNTFPAEARANSLSLCDPVPELDNLCALEHMLISQIIPFMFLISQRTGAQQKIKGQVVLVPTDLKKISQSLPRACNNDHLITIALKRRLSDKRAYKEQHIRPAMVNNALDYLVRNNSLYTNVTISNNWENLSENSDPELWKLLTSERDGLEQSDDNNASDTDDESENELLHQEGVANPTVLHNIDGPNIPYDKILDVAPGEGQIPVSLHSEPNCEAMSFPRHFPDGKNHFNFTREKPLTISKYIHTRLKSNDSRFAADPQYIFFMLDLLERTSISNAVNFSERRFKQTAISVGQLTNPENVKAMISNDEIFAVMKNIRGTPQFWHTMQLDVLAKIRHFGVPTFFLTMSAAQFQWTSIIKVIARQYGENNLSEEQIDAMDWNTKASYLKRNPVTVARQIDYIFKKIWTDVIMSGIHPIGQILNFDERSEFQSGTGNKHVHASLHIKDAPKADEDSDEAVTAFIDDHITVEIPDEKEYPELHRLVTSVQNHHHTKTCRKKKGTTCRFYCPWPPSEKTIISRANVDKKLLKHAQYIVNKVVAVIETIGDISAITFTELLAKADVSEEEYYGALETFRRKTIIIYKRKPSESTISPYNTIILDCLKANMNIQFVVSIYGVLAYLTSYLCKPEHSMSEFMKAAANEASTCGVKEKLRAIGNQFITKREVSLHEALTRGLSMPLRRSNVDVVYIPTGEKKNITRVLKPLQQLEQMDPDDEDVFAINMLDRYANRPETLEEICYASFASNYKHKSIENTKIDDDDKLESVYSTAVSGYVDVPEDGSIIKLKNDMGFMRKRSRPCVIRWHSVSKDKSPELYYLRILQLYLPWRSEDELCHNNGSYFSKYEEVKDIIYDTIMKFEPYHEMSTEDLENAYDSSDDELTNENSGDESENDFSIFDPNNLEFDSEDTVSTNISGVSCNNSNSLSIPREKYYAMCKELNNEQRALFNYLLVYIQLLKHSESNGKDHPEAFHIFLSGGGGVGKSHLVVVCYEYAKKMLKQAGQNLNQPSIILTASTGIAASRISGTSLHSAFTLPIRDGSCISRGKLSSQELHDLQRTYQYLKIIVIDEISMVGDFTFYDLYVRLQQIMQTAEPFGGLSILTVGDFLQLPPVKQKSIFKEYEARSYAALGMHLWKDFFKLHSLTTIVRQVEDTHLAELLSRVRVGKQTKDDIAFLSSMEHTNTQNWPAHHVKLFITNALADEHNNATLNSLPSEKIVIKAKDSVKDTRKNTVSVTVPDDKSVSETKGLPKTLTVCVGARVMLTKNIDISDHLVNGATGIIFFLHFSKHSPLNGEIYIKFDEEKVGNKLKSNKYPALKDCVPILASKVEFKFQTTNRKTYQVTRTQYPLKVAFAMTIHKSQGGTYRYIEVSFDQTCKSKNRLAPINSGQAYTGFSRAKLTEGIKLAKFNESAIVVNKDALHEMDRLEEEAKLDVSHPATHLTGCVLALSNIVSWSLHLSNFLSDSLHLNHCKILCFTETHLNHRPNCDVNDYVNTWRTVFKYTEHGIAISYNTEFIELIDEIPMTDQIEIMACHLRCFSPTEIDLILVVVYRKPGSCTEGFLYMLLNELQKLPSGYRTIITGDFNMDQRLKENVDLLNLFINPMNFEIKCNFSTHIEGGILDLVIDNVHSEKSVYWQPTPFSDHFVLYYNL